MYFPTSIARQFCTVPLLPNVPLESVLRITPSPHKSLFCALTRDGVRDLACQGVTTCRVHKHRLASKNMGKTYQAHWSPDGTRLVIHKLDETPYGNPQLGPSTLRTFLSGPGEALPLQALVIRFEGVIRVEGHLLSSRSLQCVSTKILHTLLDEESHHLVQRIPWPVTNESDLHSEEENRAYDYESWTLSDHSDHFQWLVDSECQKGPRPDEAVCFLRALETGQENPTILPILDTTLGGWGTCVHDVQVPKWVQKRKQVYPGEDPRRAVKVAVNMRFSLIAIGTHCGNVEYTSFPSQRGVAPKPQVLEDVSILSHQRERAGLCHGMELGWIRPCGWLGERFKDLFMNGIKDLFWGPGNFELLVLSHPDERISDGQLFAIPFAKSATTGQHIPIPQSYLATNWPIRYSAISADGRLIAIAGRRGLTHYSSTSGRWKLFSDELQEQAFTVRGGLLWFHHVLVAAVEIGRSWQLRLYSRDLELSNQNVLHRELLASPVVILSLVDNSLLVYMADNTLLHYLIAPTTDTIRLHLAGKLGDPADDLAVATVLMMVGGELVLLKPRKSGDQEVRYDMQILADRIEFCWIHLHGIGSLENSLWGYDGQGMRVWLNALTIEATFEPASESRGGHVRESVNVPLDFYPLSVLMDKGIIIGAEHESGMGTTLPFVTFRHATSPAKYKKRSPLRRTTSTSSSLHTPSRFFYTTVVESEAPNEDSGTCAKDSVLSSVIEFLDHFDVALDVVVGCARKTEMTHWRRLFDIVGNPKTLFETCLSSQRLRTAGSYLLVLHSLEQLDTGHDDAFRLLRSAVAAKDWQLCRELLRFLHSMDDSGAVLEEALAQPFMSGIDRE
ncbi:RIC1-domain-containing protein [Lactarius deliciosus]|nr:RIC1-domain-containing protein [Lactarius deliciosus]